MSRHTTFSFTLVPTRQQEEVLRRHAGAARFAYNQCLRFVVDALEAKEKAPWSGFDLINAFNGWKRSERAGVDEAGRAGLSWRGEVLQQVFEEAAVDLGRALQGFSAGRKGERTGKRPGFPKFKQKSAARQSFRIRNKKNEIRIGEAGARSVRLPKLGSFAVRESTRKLRRMLKRGRAKVLFATVSSREGGHWRVSLNVEAAELHPARRHGGAQATPVGIDRGLSTFAVLASEEGEQVEHIESPRPLRTALPKLRRKSRALSKKQLGSRNRRKARAALARVHRRISNIRHDFAHRQSSRLAQTHGHLVIEKLSISGLIKTRLSRAIADSAWALFGKLLAYKASWYGATLTEADRFYPSTRRCSACGTVGDKLDLAERTFHCSCCGHEADRDHDPGKSLTRENAAVCLAQYPRVLAQGLWPRVAAKHAETQNACGEGSSGASPSLAVRETTLVEAGRAYARRPRRAVSAETVNTL